MAGIPADLIVLERENGRKVYHRGTIWSGEATNVGPYTGPGGEPVPFHIWTTRWTHRDSPPRVVRSPKQLADMGLVFAYGDVGIPAYDVPALPVPGPMGNAGLTEYMPTTGENGDRGLVTDYSAKFLLTGNADAMLPIALTANSIPMYFRDENEDRPIDLLKYPKANNYWLADRQGSPWMASAPYSEQESWQPDTSHWPSTSYVGYVATGDLGFLEDLQYAANYVVFSDAYYSSVENGAVIGIGQARQIAWGCRNLFEAYAATLYQESLGPLPAWLHPSSYYAGLIGNEIKFLKATFVNDPTNQTFRLVGPRDYFAPWQMDYFLTAFAFGTLVKAPGAKEVYLWALRNVLDRLNGKSGYPPGYGGAYYLKASGTWSDAIDSLLADSLKPGADVQITQAQYDALKVDQFNGGHAMVGHEYLFTTRAAVVQAIYLNKRGDITDAELNAAGITKAELQFCFETVDRMVRNDSREISPRQSLVPDASASPSEIPPLPKTPKAGTIIMSDTTFNLRVGQSKSLDVVADGEVDNLTLKSSDESVIVLTDGDGPLSVKATALKVGTATITAHGTGATELTAQCVGTVSLPLATTMSLVPRS